MAAYIIADPRSGIGETLATIFPGCTVEPWDPLGTSRRGPVGQAEEFLRRSLADGETRIAFKDIQQAIGVEPKHFAARGTGKVGWQQAIARLGLDSYAGTRRARGVQLPERVRLAA